MDIEALRSICIEECGLVAERPVVVGVSGGADSLCLMYALAELGYPLVVAHFDHRLREQSNEDAGLVQTLAGQLGLPFALGSADVGALAREKHLSLEEAARKARYTFLFEQARQAGAQAVAVGHTADDQVETVIMHLLRGAGISGLKGMTFRGLLPEWDAQIPLVRPLLNVRHEDALACCESRGVVPAEDASNLDKSFFRNRLRHELLPLLESYNPQVRESLLRMARGMAGDHEVLESATEEAWSQMQPQTGAASGYRVLRLESLTGDQPAGRA
jgi:tRNA(Ile)-lysidine synthase